MKGEKIIGAKDILLDICDLISSFNDPAVELSILQMRLRKWPGCNLNQTFADVKNLMLFP